MKQVRCVNPKNYKLTLNSQYLVEEDGDFYLVVNDNGKNVRYAQDLFEDVQVVVQQPVIPEPPRRTEQDCINSIDVHGRTISYTDINNNNISFEWNYGYSDTNISCGIEQLYRIDDLMNLILDNVDTDDNDFEDLIKELFVRTLKSVISTRENRFVLISTAYDNEFEDFYRYLSELSHVETGWMVNPNSGNEIKMWTINNEF